MRVCHAHPFRSAVGKVRSNNLLGGRHCRSCRHSTGGAGSTSFADPFCTFYCKPFYFNSALLSALLTTICCCCCCCRHSLTPPADTPRNSLTVVALSCLPAAPCALNSTKAVTADALSALFQKTANCAMSALSPLSPVEDWSPATGYQAYSTNANNNNNNSNNNNNILKGGPDTPPVSSHTSASTSGSNEQMQPNMARRRPSNGNPSPPSSVAGSVAGSIDSRRAYMIEEQFSEHYTVLKNYLAPYLRDERPNQQQKRARDKLVRLSLVQFQELSTDVYDEFLRREDESKEAGQRPPTNNTPKYLLPKENFHVKRNQARQKLSTLPIDRFRQLATDVFYELERRYPLFMGGVRPASRAPSFAGSIMSMDSRGPPPSQMGTPNVTRPPRIDSRGLGDVRGAPPRGAPPPYGRANSPFNGPPPGIQPGLDTPPSDYGRPTPKTYQSNTIVPNKGTLVEDDGTGSVVDEPANDGLMAEYKSQIAKLEEKVDSLQGELMQKTVELEKASVGDSTLEAERAEWGGLRRNLEQKLEEAQALNDSLQMELNKLREDNAAVERDLRKQLDDARRSERDLERDLRAQIDQARREGLDMERDLRAQLENVRLNENQNLSRADGAPEDWQRRCESLEKQLMDQQATTDEVRREASQFLQEMRILSEQSTEALEKEERLLDQVSQLGREVREWKSRYAKAKTRERSLRASTLGLPSANGASPQYSQFMSPDGLVKDFHVTNYQLAIDELLQLVRKQDASNAINNCMKQVVMGVRRISNDVDTVATPDGTLNSTMMGDLKDQARAKMRLSQTCNNLITAVKNHASADGLSPVSLVDAASSNLTAAVIDMLRLVKIRPTPLEELERLEQEEEEEMVAAKPVPLRIGSSRTKSTFSEDSNASNRQNGRLTPNGLTVNGHKRNVSSMSSTGYSAYSRYSSRYSNNTNGDVNGRGLGISQAMDMLRESGVEEFKAWLHE